MPHYEFIGESSFVDNPVRVHVGKESTHGYHLSQVLFIRFKAQKRRATGAGDEQEPPPGVRESQEHGAREHEKGERGRAGARAGQAPPEDKEFERPTIIYHYIILITNCASQILISIIASRVLEEHGITSTANTANGSTRGHYTDSFRQPPGQGGQASTRGSHPHAAGAAPHTGRALPSSRNSPPEYLFEDADAHAHIRLPHMLDTFAPNAFDQPSKAALHSSSYNFSQFPTQPYDVPQRGRDGPQQRATS
eukprot:gene24521-10125_t